MNTMNTLVCLPTLLASVRRKTKEDAKQWWCDECTISILHFPRGTKAEGLYSGIEGEIIESNSEIDRIALGEGLDHDINQEENK
jgi:hypothetical protein